jgi:hypothetical protein
MLSHDFGQAIPIHKSQGSEVELQNERTRSEGKCMLGDKFLRQVPQELHTNHAPNQKR